MGTIRDIHNQVNEAVTKGTDQVETLHRQIANWPLDELGKIEALREPITNVRQFQEMALGGLYGMVRSVQQRVAEGVEMVIDQVEPRATSSTKSQN